MMKRQAFFWLFLVFFGASAEFFAQGTCPAATGGGPYRKIISTQGFRKVDGNITLPSVSLVDYLNNDGKPDDVAYIHMGGTAWNAAKTSQTEVDAGLKLEIIPGNTQSYKWRPFIAVSNYGENPYPDKPFIEPGTPVTLRFFVDPTQDNYVKLQVIAAGVNWTSPAVYAPNFTNAGTYQQLKRVNSLGQKTPGYKGSSVNAAQWTNLTLYNQTAGFAWDGARTSMACTQPTTANDPAPYVVNVTTHTTYSSETISINTNNW